MNSKGCEIFLPGVHSDIGGGYPQDFAEEDMVIYEVIGHSESVLKEALERERNRLIEEGWYKDHQLRIVHKRGQHSNHQPHGATIPPSGRILTNRVVKNDYNRIPLHIMAEFAEEKGVSVLSKIRREHEISQSLTKLKQVIDRKKLAPGSIGRLGLDAWDDDMELIKSHRNKYIHFSANYDSPANPPNFSKEGPVNGFRVRANRAG